MNERYLGTVGSTPHQEHVRIFALTCKTHLNGLLRTMLMRAHWLRLARKDHPAKRPGIHHLHTLMMQSNGRKANQSAPACTTNSSGFRLSVAPTFPQPSFAFLRWSVEAKGCKITHPPLKSGLVSARQQRVRRALLRREADGWMLSTVQSRDPPGLARMHVSALLQFA